MHGDRRRRHVRTPTIDESLASLKARSIPVFTVGVGQERFAQRHSGDARRDAAHRAQRHRAGRRRRAVADRLRRPDRPAQRRRRRPDREHAGGDAAVRRRGRRPCRCASPPSKPGARVFKFRSPTQPGEQVTQNNARDALIEVNDRAEKVLYFEGEPRLEMKFIRRARRGRQEPAGGRRCSAPPRTSATGVGVDRRRRADRRLSEDARGAVRVPRASSSAASKRRRSRPSSCG